MYQYKNSTLSHTLTTPGLAPVGENEMGGKKIIKKLENRIEYLEENRRFIQNSLEMALSLGDFHEEIGNDYTPYQIYEETEKRVRHLIQFETYAFYFIAQHNSDLQLSLCKPEKCRRVIEDEMEFFIEKGFVAWAMRERRGVLLLSKDQKRQILLHVISTRSGIRGMFVGVFPLKQEKIPDASLDLLSIILRNTANALGSIDYRERIQSERELKDSKERIERILFSLPTGIVIIDYETHEIIDVNPKAASMIGVPKGRIIGSKCNKFLCPAQECECPVTDLGQTIENSERILITANSENIPILKSVISITLGGKKCLIESFIDISRQKQAEKALSDSEEKHRTLFKSSKDAIMMLEPPDWRFTGANSSAIKLFMARDEQHFFSNTPWNFSPVYQQDGELSRDKAIRMIKTAINKGSVSFEWTHKKLNGEEFPATVLLSRVELGEKQSLQATVRDISQQKRLEESRLEKEKLQGVIEMAGAVCHELNQPLQVVYGYSDILLMSRAKDNPDYDSIHKIRVQTERIKEITEKFMSITKYETKDYLTGKIIDIDRASEARLIIQKRVSDDK